MRSGQVRSVGVGSFGPLDLDPRSPSYGRITSTPKPGWQDADLLGSLRSRLNVDVVLDTDVNAAALGEFRWGASRGADPSLYLTVGTGIGGGLISAGKPYHGLLNPEMGHMRIPHDFARDPFPGSCPFHGDCLEGLASGPAILARTGRLGQDLADDDPFWELEAGYLAEAIANFILTLSPRRVILGGGVMERGFLLDGIRARVLTALNGYVRHAGVMEHIDEYILPAGLGKRAGLLGSIALAIAKDEAKEQA